MIENNEVEGATVIERDVRSMSNYMKQQLKKDIQEATEPLVSCLHTICATTEDLRIELESLADLIRDGYEL